MTNCALSRSNINVASTSLDALGQGSSSARAEGVDEGLGAGLAGEGGVAEGLGDEGEIARGEVEGQVLEVQGAVAGGSGGGAVQKGELLAEGGGRQAEGG